MSRPAASASVLCVCRYCGKREDPPEFRGPTAVADYYAHLRRAHPEIRMFQGELKRRRARRTKRSKS